MRIPNADRAIISRDKILYYLLNPEHRRGGSKAQLLSSLGYRRQAWRQLEDDLRQQHLTRDIDRSSESIFGIRYEIIAPITTPSGRNIVFRSIWQVDSGTNDTRLITMYPE